MVYAEQVTNKVYTFFKISLVYEQELNFAIPSKSHFLVNDHCSGHPHIKGLIMDKCGCKISFLDGPDQRVFHYFHQSNPKNERKRGWDVHTQEIKFIGAHIQLAAAGLASWSVSRQSCLTGSGLPTAPFLIAGASPRTPL